MPARCSALRVVSLLPSATENVCALLSACQSSSSSLPSSAAVPQLVGRSHECDFPADASVQQLPVLTAARTAFTSSADTHSQVREALASASSLYHLDAARLAALRPDVILTQSSCKVCSIDLASVRAAVDSGTDGQLQQLVQAPNGAASDAAAEACELRAGGQMTQIVTCNPTSLEDALVQQFQQLGEALGVAEVGEAMAQQHRSRLQQLKEQARVVVDSKGSRPRVLMVEWLEPLFLSTKGWMREIVEAAGGHVVEDLEDGEEVDVVVVALCGLSLDKTETELLEGRVGDWWTTLLKGEAQPKVFIVDGTSMFTRPTRRLLVALEWLVHALHEPESSWMKDSTFPYKLFDTSLVASDSKADETKSAEMLEIEELHRAACANKQAMYTDPATGYFVMTEYILKERQVCCGNGCRHCPYGHANVKDPSRRKNTLAGNVFLQPRRRSRGFAKGSPGGQTLWPEGADAGSDAQNDLVVMFWSGGKDSFLALGALYESYAAEQKPMPRVVLLTTIDPKTNVVPIQDIPSQTIAAQAEALELPLCLVAVGLGDEYTAALRSALQGIPEQMKRTKKSSKSHAQNGTTPSVSSLVFGDLHLEDIRAWREQTFSQDYKLRFPVWKKDYESELLPSLERLCSRTGAKIYLSSIDKDQLASKGIGADWQVGQEYDWKLVQECNKAAVEDANRVDLMGECGEFHTCVKFPGMD